MPPGRAAPRRGRAVALAAALALAAAVAHGAPCAEGLAPVGGGTSGSADASAPRIGMLGLVEAAAQRSKAVGAARLLAEAAASDVEEVRASQQVQAALTGSLGPAGTMPVDGSMRTSLQMRFGLAITAPFYDNGRAGHLTRWRQSLADAARLGQIGLQEQVALQTVTLAFDRSRYRLHAQVWQQYAQKVCGIVDSLEQIVARDRGRGSELAQARKALQEVLLAGTQARTQLSLTETRLRRLVGEPLPDAAGLSALMLVPPPLEDLRRDAGAAPDIAALEAQAQAADSLAQATAASQSAQAGWLVSMQSTLGRDRNAAWNAGLSLSLPLLNPGAQPAVQAARLRAEAARLQREDALESLRHRLAEVHEQATASMQRARDVVQAVRESEQVRADTLAQWQQLGRRSLFDVISAEGDHFALRLAYVDALHDGQQAVALMWSLAGGVVQPLR